MRHFLGFGDGHDGIKTVSSSEDYAGANAGCSGTSGNKTLTIDSASSFADGDKILIHQTRGTGAGSWELNQIISGGGTTTLTLLYDLENTYIDSGASQAQAIEVKEFSSLTVNSSQNYRASAWDGNKGGIIAFMCNGKAVISGSIVASEKGFRGGANDPGSDPKNGYQGESSLGVGTQSASNNGAGGGGAAKRSGDDAAGGGGGYATAGAAGDSGAFGNTGGSGGATVGLADLTSLFFGGAGGGTGGTGTAGGNGGGIIVIFSNQISISGAMQSNGQSISTASMAGGGGAGGSVLIKSRNIAAGSGLLTATGGTSDSTAVPNGDGGAGGDGRIRIESCSLSGTTSPSASQVVGGQNYCGNGTIVQ